MSGQLPMSEAELQDAVIGAGRLAGFLVAHFRPALTKHGWRTPVQADGAGFPDLLMVKPPRLVVAELKAQKGRLTPEQELWLNRFAEVPGVEAYEWRPDDLDDAIEVLTAKRVRR